MKPSSGWLSRKRRREAAYQRGFEAGQATATVSREPIAYLRHGEKTFVQNVPFGAMWISDKDDPRAFPVYDCPLQPALDDVKKDAEQVNRNVPERLWLGAANDDGDHETWFAPDEGGTAYVRADVVAIWLENLQRENERLRANRNLFAGKYRSIITLMERARQRVQEIFDHLDDEGDRVYLGSTNHRDWLRDMLDHMDRWSFDAMLPKGDINKMEADPYAEIRTQRARAEAAEAELKQLVSKRESLNVDHLAARIVTAACEIDGPADPGAGDTISITMKDLEAVVHRHVTTALE